MIEQAAENDALRTLQLAERETRRGVNPDPLLADVFRVAAMNTWAYGPPCEGECDDTGCEYVRPILALATRIASPANTGGAS